MNSQENWDSHFMSICAVTSYKSKDKSTKIGAVIVGPDNEIRSSGYNSFVRGLNDDLEIRQERPIKYFYFEHAERNAIYNAALIGSSLKGCKIYINGLPCSDCARGIIQVGIKELIYFKRWEDFNKTIQNEKWLESAKHSLNMFEETNVKIREWDGELLENLYFINRGNKIQ